MERVPVAAVVALVAAPAPLRGAWATRGALLSSAWYGNHTFTLDEIFGHIDEAGTTADAPALAKQQIGAPRYAVRACQTVYTSVDHTGQEIPVSGVVLVPQRPGSLLLLFYQHATIIENKSAASDVGNSGQTKALMGAFATAGYLVAMTGYVGTGLETQYPGEYLYAASESANGADTIPAMQTLLGQLGVQRNGQLFLSGCPEGGQAVSALAELLQAGYPQYPVTAAAFMEGPYDMTTVMNTFLDTPGGVTPDDMPVGTLISAKAVCAYQNIHNWGPMAPIFRCPNDRRVQEDFSRPNPPILQLAVDFPADTRSIFEPAFLASARSGQAAAGIAANNTDDRIPRVPVTFISSTGDTLVLCAVTQGTSTRMRDQGGTVSLLTTHYPPNHLQKYFPAVALSRTVFDPL